MAKLLVNNSEVMMNLLHALEQVNPENKTRVETVFETHDEATARMLEGLGAERLITAADAARAPAGKEGKAKNATKIVTMGVCKTCGKDRELAKDGECKIYKMSRGAADKAKRMGLPGDEPVVYAGVDKALEVTLDEPPNPALGTTPPFPEGKGTDQTFTPRGEGTSKAEMRLRENMDRVVEQARARGEQQQGSWNKLPAQRERVQTQGRKLG